MGLLAASGSGDNAAAARGRGRTPSNPKPAERLDRPSPAAGARADLQRDGAADRLGADEKAILIEPDDPGLEVTVPDRGATEAWLGRFLLLPERARVLRRSHGGRLPAAGRPLQIPLADLNDDYRYLVVRALFPQDGPIDGGWRHLVGAGQVAAERESLRLVARAYTPGPENAPLLSQVNPEAGKGMRSGQVILVPVAILHAAFARRTAEQGPGGGAAHRRATGRPPDGAPPPGPAGAAAGASASHIPVLPPLDEALRREASSAGQPSGTAPETPSQGEPEDDFTEAPSPAEEGEEGTIAAPPPGPPAPPPVAEGAGDLTYGLDDSGRYAAYRLKRGEALYSAVVVRFTGRIDVQEVNDLASRIAQRSGIADVTNIPIGFKVRIPLDDLLPEYLPREDPRRQAWERQHAEVARYTNLATSRGLEGVAVILDAGHGGRDIGAAHNGIWEHDYVYDILCRIKSILERTTGARVLPIIKDTKEGFAIRDSTRLRRSRAEVLLTSPPFPLTERAPSVNLRWYLSNSHYRRLVGEGFDPFKIVFTSLHADARHPSLSGAMIYVPGEEFRRGRYGHSGAVYARYREARDEPYVSFTREQRERSEGLSRQFGAALVGAFGARGVAVHPYQPVRERIIRRGRSWVPAVLRCNIVPVEVLIETANLSNAADSSRLAEPAYRQKVAEAYVDALHAYFSGSDRRPAVHAGGGR
jgi:N-acetylmuramoyl-L-alanine amidase